MDYYFDWNTVPFETLVGKTLVQAVLINEGEKNPLYEEDRQAEGDLIIFKTASETFRMCHHQSCCEGVSIEDIAGDLNDLVESEVLYAYESSNSSSEEVVEGDESYTWTYYRIGTVKGSVVIRWYGSSNGYYSESVDFEKLKERLSNE